jgi:hypothetical protein
MGLDIYLKKCPDLAAANAAEQARDEEIEALWEEVGGYNKATEAQRAEIGVKADEIAKKHGCTGYFGDHASITAIDAKASTIDPEHMFKIGYFRSSYNGGGINHVLENIGLPTLHEIFQPNDQYEFKPDWDAALARCNGAIAGYEAHLASPMGKYSAMFVDAINQVSNERDALEIFAKEVAREHAPDFRSYSNGQGTFYRDGIKAVGFMPGRSIINTPGMYVVYEKEVHGKPDWYLTALKIVRETIEHVIAQPDSQHFYLTWSG